MSKHRIFGIVIMAAAVISAPPAEVSGQVVEGRDDEANPASVLFRSTLYGVGTGVVLGGAYALINNDDDTWDILRWSVAGGAVGGLMVGLIHLATRSDPEDSAEDAALFRHDAGSWQISVMSLHALRLGPAGGTDLRLARITF